MQAIGVPPTYCLNDVVGPEGNVLDTSPSIVSHILLYLTHLLPRSWLIDWHLYCTFIIGDDH